MLNENVVKSPFGISAKTEVPKLSKQYQASSVNVLKTGLPGLKTPFAKICLDAVTSVLSYERVLSQWTELLWMCVAAGVVGHQRLPLCPLLHGLPAGEMVLHQVPARGESHLPPRKHANA